MQLLVLITTYLGINLLQAYPKVNNELTLVLQPFIDFSRCFGTSGMQVVTKREKVTGQG